MTRLEDQRKPGLPPAPAPTRRATNPWKFSNTARKPETQPEAQPEARLEVEPDAEPEAQARNGGGDRPNIGLWPLVVLAIAILVITRALIGARSTGNWAGLVAPLLAILFIAHGWWRLRQRRRQPWDRSAAADEKK